MHIWRLVLNVYYSMSSSRYWSRFIGIYQQPTEEQNERDRIGADRAKWLAEQRKKDLQREREREREKKRDKERAAAAGRGGGGSSRELDREKEYEASYREREKIREWEQRMVNYKPDVSLEYVDEFGRQMTTKEVFSGAQLLFVYLFVYHVCVANVLSTFARLFDIYRTSSMAKHLAKPRRRNV